MLKEPKHYANLETDNYIIEDLDNPKMRNAIPDVITRAFTHYRQLAGIKKQIVFSSSRKSWVTQKAIKDGIGSASKELHENLKTTVDHYINELEYLSKTEKTARLYE